MVAVGALMRGALDNAKGVVEVRDIPVPERFHGSALIRVRRAGICGSDLHMNRERTEPQTLPSGHEIAGEVAELPPGERRLAVGDRVALETIGQGRACASCWYCQFGQYRHCLSRAPDTGGGFAEQMTRLPLGLHKLPDSLDWTAGALVEPLAVSVHALRWGGMRPGETVAIIGGATIGLTATVAARALGAGTIITSARHGHQARAAGKLGADMVVADERGVLEQAAREATEGRGADVVVETVGGTSLDTLEQAIATVRPQGRIIVVGGFRERRPLDLLTPMLNEVTFLLSSCYGIVDGRHDYQVAIDLLQGPAAGLADIVTHRFPLDQIQRGFEEASDKASGSLKVHIVV